MKLAAYASVSAVVVGALLFAAFLLLMCFCLFFKEEERVFVMCLSRIVYLLIRCLSDVKNCFKF